MVRIINTTQELDIPKGVTLVCKNRQVTVTGPRGTLTRDFRHTQLQLSATERKFRVELWFGDRKAVACCKTIVSAVRNCIKGVTAGFEIRMRAAYAHFPVSLTNNSGVLEIRGYLGEKVVRKVAIPAGVAVTLDTGVKDEMQFIGNDLDVVSQFAASIQQICRPRNKDIRKFLDGIYVSKSCAIGEA